MRPHLAAPAALLALIAPAALAAPTPATTSTGDVDTYAIPPAWICLQVVTPWHVRLTLLDPAPGDAVLLAVETAGPGPGAPAGAAVARADAPTASVNVLSTHGCRPPTEVVGLHVDGERPYAIEWCYRACR